MIYLGCAALIWAFSIALIGNQLAGVDVWWIAAGRMGLAFAAFAFFWRPSTVRAPLAARLMLIGAVQYGAMFVLYLFAFQSLKSYEVALFTITTPFWVALLNGARESKFHLLFWAAVAASILGAWLLQPHRELSKGTLLGFLWVQSADVCFAWGQLAYKRLRARHATLSDAHIYAYLYLGALLCTLPAAILWGDGGTFRALALRQWGVLGYLGLISSGLTLFLWNKGATRVNAGSLAAANNLKIPLTVVIAWFIFNEKPVGLDTLEFSLGCLLIFAAVLLPFFNRTALSQH